MADMSFLTDPFLIDPADLPGPVLVTGAGGCIGAWVLAILHRSGVPVIASDLQKSSDRAALVMGAEAADALEWVSLDVTDGAAIADLVSARGVASIIHLAGLQVPFCAANPALGARVNVEGTINILEAARHSGIKRTVFASSVAAHSFPPGKGFKETLYGAYKVANEQTAFVYWADWEVPSVCLRPNLVYGVARDQGVSAKNTLGLQAAVLGVPFEIGFSGPYNWLYAGECAAAFIAAVRQDGVGAHCFDLNGQAGHVEDGLAVLSEQIPDHQITGTGPVFPFPPDLDEAPLRAHVPEYPTISILDGVTTTIRAFQELKLEGRLPKLSS